MLKSDVILKSAAIAIFYVTIGLLFSSFMSGCATTGEPGAAEQPAEEEEMSPAELAAQKAKQDSLKEVYRRELLIAYSTGTEHNKNQNFRDAIKPLWKAARMDTAAEFPSIYRKLGESYMKLDKPDSALVAYQQALEKYPENAYYWRSVAWLQSAKQNNEEAIEAYYNAIENDPGKISDYKNLGRLLVAEDRTGEAINIYKELTELAPNDAEAQNVYAQLLSRTGDQEAVIEAKEKALQANPDDVSLMFDLAQTYYKRGEYEKAIEKYNMLLEKNPEDRDALEYKGNALQYNEQYRRAIETYEKALAIQPDNARVMAEMAACYMELGNFKKAMSVANKAINIDPSYGMSYIVKGDIYVAVADNCIAQREKSKTTYDDKLVYQLAYDQYAKAADTDIQVADLARKKMRSIQPETPTTEDKFLHPDKKKATGECYDWLY